MTKQMRVFWLLGNGTLLINIVRPFVVGSGGTSIVEIGSS